MESNGTQLKQSPVVLFAQISPTHSAHLTTEIILPFLLIKDIGIPLRNPLTDAVVAFYTYVCTTIKKPRQATYQAPNGGMLVCMSLQQKRGKIKAPPTTNIPTTWMRLCQCLKAAARHPHSEVHTQRPTHPSIHSKRCHFDMPSVSVLAFQKSAKYSNYAITNLLVWGN